MVRDKFSRATNFLSRFLQATIFPNAWIIVIGLIFFALIYPVLPLLKQESPQNNQYALLAESLLHGKLSIEKPLYDTASFNGNIFVPFPPFPAILLLPSVAIFGLQNTSSLFTGILLSAVSVFFLVKILLLLELQPSEIPWLVAAFFLGTGYWLAINMGGLVYYFAHLSAICFLLLALYVSMKHGNGLLAGFFIGCAFLSRQMTIFASLLVLVILWNHFQLIERVKRWRNLFAFAIGLGACVGLYLFYNWGRFGDLFQTGYSLIRLDGFLKARVDQYGIFSLAYVPFNFMYMFIQGPQFLFGGSRNLVPVNMDGFGTSILWASPFVIAAVYGRLVKSLMVSAWASLTLILSGALLYYNNGWVQWNTQRFSLDFLPVLILLVALGMKNKSSWIWRVAILYSVALNAFLILRLLPHIR
jgi:hypothetical protein